MSTVTFPPTMSKEETLRALWDAQCTLGMGFAHSHEAPSAEKCKKFLKRGGVDYLNGKAIKTWFGSYPVLDPSGYDRIAGTGTMAKVANGTAEKRLPTKKLTQDEKFELEEKNPLTFETLDPYPDPLALDPYPDW
jgi:hypothetical protein